MSYEPCPKCEKRGKVRKEVPVASDAMGWVEEDCDLCDGVGWLYEDVTPQVVERLDEIKEILKQIQEAIK